MPPSSSIPHPRRSYNKVYTPQSPHKLDISTLPDPFLAGPFSPSPSRSRPPQPKPKPKTRRYDTTAAQRGRTMEQDFDDTNASRVRSSQPSGETEPLLPRTGETSQRVRKPFYRPRPMWIVPFAIIAAISRGMTLAPRVEVFTQLACNALHHPYNHTSGSDHNILGLFLSSVSAFVLPSVPQHADIIPLPIHFPQESLETVDLDDRAPKGSGSDDDDDDTDDPRRLPSQSCLSDPAVQAGAARLQTIMTTTMGVLSALTTGWWGHLGERHGRVKILAASTLGLLLTDLAFILVSTPSSPFSHHGHILILLSPLTEGLLGGWATLQAITSAYVSDCTSDGSRSHIFSRFTGVFYLGFSLGPTIGAFLIRHPAPWFESDGPHAALAGVTHPRVGVPTVTTVFWVAIMCSAVNLFLAVFVLPESLDKARRKAALKAEADAAAGVQPVVKTAKPPQGGVLGMVKRAVGPLAIFAPKRRIVGAVDGFGGRKQRDWSLTWLALAFFGYLLSIGIFQIKYLYAEHVYGWGAEQLSYYISFVGGARAVHLLFVMPLLISMFKPTTATTSSTPTPATLHNSISFDLALARLSLLLDITSHSLVAVLGGQSSSLGFSGLTVLSSFASGVHPAVQSLAICIMQRNGHSEGLGPLFGALSFLQAVGQMILGPLVFGLVYSSTVARFPGAIFVLAAGLAATSLAFLLLVRAEPVPKASPGPAVRKGKGKAKRGEEDEPERGRSRTKKPVGEAGGSRLVAPDV